MTVHTCGGDQGVVAAVHVIVFEARSRLASWVLVLLHRAGCTHDLPVNVRARHKPGHTLASSWKILLSPSSTADATFGKVSTVAKREHEHERDDQSRHQCEAKFFFKLVSGVHPLVIFRWGFF